MHFRTTLLFDSFFYNDAVSFPVLMEIFVEHKTSSVLVKLEFNYLKKKIINYFSRNFLWEFKKSWDLKGKNRVFFNKIILVMNSLSFSNKNTIKILLNKGFHINKSYSHIE